MALNSNEFLNGLFSLIFVILTVYVGITIVSKYFKYKQRTFLYVGFTWIGVSSPYIATSISFILAVITSGDGLLNHPTIYFFIAIAFVPPILVLWMTAMAEFLAKERKKPIMIVFVIIGVILEIISLSYLFTDPSLIGQLESPVDTDWSTFMKIYYISMIILLFITGMLFARGSFKSNDPQIRLKGKFLVIAFILFILGAILDAFIDTPIIRLVMMISSITFYFGFILPDWMKKALIKQKQP